MRKSEQICSRKRNAKANRLQALNRKRRRWWKATVVRHLWAPNSRAARRARMADLLDRGWAMPMFRTATRPERFRRRGKMVTLWPA